MADLHTLIRDKIAQRRVLAEAARKGRQGGRWQSLAGRDGMTGIEGEFGIHHRAGGYAFGPSEAFVAYVIANDPIVELRRLDAAERVLGRHSDYEGRCTECMEWCECDLTARVEDCPCRGNQPHPCPEICDLADALGIDVAGIDIKENDDVMDIPWFAEEEAQRLLVAIAKTEIANIDLRWRVRVDEPHPRRREKAGDFIDMADGRVTLAARHIWAGWTPGFVVEVTLTDGTRVIGPWTQRLVCCDVHGVNCEQWTEPCCGYCSEAFHPKHAIMPCVLADIEETT